MAEIWGRGEGCRVGTSPSIVLQWHQNGLGGLAQKLRGEMGSGIHHLHADNPAISVIVQHNAGRYLFIFFHRRSGDKRM
jgi:hypothetical protein